MHKSHRAEQLDVARTSPAVHSVKQRFQPEEEQPTRSAGALLRLLQLRTDAQVNPDDTRYEGRDCSEAVVSGGVVDGSTGEG